jgi:hypothetical protein
MLIYQRICWSGTGCANSWEGKYADDSVYPKLSIFGFMLLAVSIQLSAESLLNNKYLTADRPDPAGRKD